MPITISDIHGTEGQAGAPVSKAPIDGIATGTWLVVRCRLDVVLTRLDSGWTLARLEPVGTGPILGSFVAKGVALSAIVTGGTYDVMGTVFAYRGHNQLDATDAAAVCPTTIAGEVAWLSQVKGIGPVRAHAIAAVAGPDFLSRVNAGLIPQDDAIDLVASAHGISKALAESVVAMVRESFRENRARSFVMSRFGLSKAVAESVVEAVCGRVAHDSRLSEAQRDGLVIRELSDNPWALVGVDGVKDALEHATAAARANPASDPLDGRRVMAHVEDAMHEAMKAGDTMRPVACMRADVISGILKTGWPEPIAHGSDVMHAVDACLASLDQRRWYVEDGLMGPAVCHCRELDVIRAFSRTQGSPAMSALSGTDGFRMALARVAAGCLSKGHPLTHEQLHVLVEAFASPSLLVCAAAGTGKTTTVIELARLANRLAVPVRVMALSGKAASVVADKAAKAGVRLEASTAHRALLATHDLGMGTGSLADDAAAFEAFAKICPDRVPRIRDGGLLVIDEASMMDSRTMSAVCRHAMRCHETLVLVGDDVQLAPVDAGSPFVDLVEAARNGQIPKLALASSGIGTDGRIPRLVLASLTRNFRQESGSPVACLGADVRCGMWNPPEAYSGKGSFYELWPSEPPESLPDADAESKRVHWLADLAASDAADVANAAQCGRKEPRDQEAPVLSDSGSTHDLVMTTSLVCVRELSHSGRMPLVVCPTNELRQQLNKALRPLGNPDLDPTVPALDRSGTRVFQIGDRVVCLSNDYDDRNPQGVPYKSDDGSNRLLAPAMDVSLCPMNGDLGVVKDYGPTLDTLPARPELRDFLEANLCKESHAWACVEFDRMPGRLICFVGDRIAKSVDLAYALTVHKSQGSQASCVVFCMPPKRSPGFYNRSLLYTAVTRSKDKLVLVGDDWALSTMAATPAPRRRTFLAAMLGLAR